MAEVGPALRRRGLQVLVVGTEVWAVDRAVRALQQAGHTVVPCPAADRPPDACPVLDGSSCGLDEHLDVVLSVRAHPLARVVRSEFGTVCALRRGVPLVVAGSTAGNPFALFATVTVDLDGDLVAACTEAVASTAGRPCGASIDELELLARRRPQSVELLRFEHGAHPVPVHRYPVTG